MTATSPPSPPSGLDRRAPAAPPRIIACAFAVFFAITLRPSFAAKAPGAKELKEALRAESALHVDGHRAGRDALWLDTPEDLIDSGASLVHARLLSPGRSFEGLKTLVVRRPDRFIVGSGAEHTEGFALGSLGHVAPPPPGWTRPKSGQRGWTPAQPVDPGPLAPFLNGGDSLWWGAKAEPGEGLLRQSFDLELGRAPALATLRIAGRAQIAEAWLNGRPILLGGLAPGGWADYEVGRLLRDGRNTLALRALSPRAAPLEQPSVAFTLELDRHSPRQLPPAVNPAEALVVGRDGQRFWGRVEFVDAQGIKLVTAFGVCGLDWASVVSLIFPEGWHTGANAAPPPARRARLGLSRRPELTGSGVPTDIEPGDLSGHVLTLDGRLLPAEPTALLGGELHATGPAGAMTLKTAEVAAIYPPLKSDAAIFRPNPNLEALYCELSTVRGERFAGLLRRANRLGAVLEARGGGFLKFPAEAISRLDFRFHFAPAKGPLRIGLVGRLASADPDPTFERLSLAIQQASVFAGVECVFPDPAALADPGRLTPDAFGAVIVFDPDGAYPDSVRAEGDAREALARYVETGGRLILYSRGGALRVAARADGGPSFPEGETALAARLRLRTLHPGQELPPGLSAIPLRPLDRPPGDGECSAYRVQAPRRAPTALPESFELGPMSLAPYYPMFGPAGEVVYELRDSKGKSFGPLMTRFPRGEGEVVVVDHLLWDAFAEGRPFVESALPGVLRWATTR